MIVKKFTYEMKGNGLMKIADLCKDKSDGTKIGSIYCQYHCEHKGKVDHKKNEVECNFKGDKDGKNS